MSNINKYILNKQYLILFWFYCLFFQHFVTQLLLPESIRAIIWHGLWVIDILWTVIILAYDVYKKNIHLKDKKILVLLIFVVINTISWLLFDPTHGPYSIFTLVTLYAQSFVFYSYALEHDIKALLIKLAYLFIGFTSFYTIISLICYITGNISFTLPNGTEIEMLGIDDSIAHKTRFMGIWTWYTVASFDCYISILFSLYLLDFKKHKVYHLVMILLNSIMIYLTDSRSSLIILAFIYLCVFLFFLKNKIGTKKTLLCGVIAAIIIIIAGLLLITKKHPDLFILFMDNPHDTLKLLSSGRLEMAEGILANLKDTWLLGNGYCNNTLVISYYNIPHPHNVIMATLLYSGISGLITFVLFIILNIQAIIQNIHAIFRNQLKWILVLIICLCIESMFDICIIGAPVNIQTLFFWFCLGFIAKESV